MLKFIGNGSAFNVNRGNNSAYYIEEDKMLLIDCGSNIFERILKANLLQGINEIHVLVTHTHADHVGSLADLILYTYYSHGEFAKPKVTVHGKSRLLIQSLLELNGVTANVHYTPKTKKGYANNVENNFLFPVFNEIGYQIFNTIHVDEILSTGFLLHIDNQEIYYSGDTSDIPHHEIELLKDGYYKTMYIDTCKADYEGNVHLSLRKLTELIPTEHRSKVYCMHLDNNFDVDEAEELGFNVTKNIFED